MNRMRSTAKRILPPSVRYRLRSGTYRTQVGGRWEEIGDLQRDYLIGEGLAPEHNMLDVGCGALRGGLRFVDYLDAGNYHGIDIDEQLIRAGERELEKAGLTAKQPHLIVDDAFRFGRFEQEFDYALAVSVFTHLPFNTIMRCLGEMENTLKPGGRFYATFYLNTGPRLNLEARKERNAGVVTIDADPYGYDPDAFRWAVEGSRLSCDVIGDWGHPRNQQMLRFTRA